MKDGRRHSEHEHSSDVIQERCDWPSHAEHKDVCFLQLLVLLTLTFLFTTRAFDATVSFAIFCSVLVLFLASCLAPYCMRFLPFSFVWSYHVLSFFLLDFLLCVHSSMSFSSLPPILWLIGVGGETGQTRLPPYGCGSWHPGPRPLRQYYSLHSAGVLVLDPSWIDPSWVGHW